MNLNKLNQEYPGKTAVVTGAGSGLGVEFARILSANGWKLHLTDLNLEPLEKLKESLGGKEVHTYAFDVSDRLSYERVSKEILEKAKNTDLLINNAGIGDGDFFQQYELENWERMIRINLLGTYYGCHYFAPYLINNKRGTIINIGSAAGFMNTPGMSAYNVSKAGVYSLSETLFHELKHYNIHVAVAMPTFFKTNIVNETKGSPAFRSFAEKQMKYSTTNAQEMANIVLSKASNKVFQIIHPKEARRNHFIKKWFPGLVSKEFEKMVKKLSRK